MDATFTPATAGDGSSRTHNVGYGWTGSSNYAGTPTATVKKYVFDGDGVFGDEVRSSPEIRDKVLDALHTVKTSAQAYFSQNPSDSQVVTVRLQGNLAFNESDASQGGGLDLAYAVHGTTAFDGYLNVTVKNDGALTISDIQLTNNSYFDDFYDFDFEGAGQNFVHSAAVLQTGFGTLTENSGKVYEYRLYFGGSLNDDSLLPHTLADY